MNICITATRSPAEREVVTLLGTQRELKPKNQDGIHDRDGCRRCHLAERCPLARKIERCDEGRRPGRRSIEQGPQPTDHHHRSVRTQLYLLAMIGLGGAELRRLHRLPVSVERRQERILVARTDVPIEPAVVSHRAHHAPLNTLDANWAYMVIASLARTLKAWFALLLPASPRWREKQESERETVLRMEFRTFLNRLILVPAQVVRTGRRVVFRFLARRPELHLLVRSLTGA